MTGRPRSRPFRVTPYAGPSRCCSACTYAVVEVPGSSATSYRLGVTPGSARASVCQSVIMARPLLPWANTSPTIFTGTSLPPETSVTVSPTDLPVSVRNPVPTTAWPGPVYQCPLIMA